MLEATTLRAGAETDLEMREEVFVSALEDVELGVVEFGILVHGAVSLPDEAAHPRAALRRELAVEDDDDAFLRAGRDDGRFEEEVLHLVLLVEVQSSLRRQKTNSSFIKLQDVTRRTWCRMSESTLTLMCPPSNS